MSKIFTLAKYFGYPSGLSLVYDNLPFAVCEGFKISRIPVAIKVRKKIVKLKNSSKIRVPLKDLCRFRSKRLNSRGSLLFFILKVRHMYCCFSFAIMLYSADRWYKSQLDEETFNSFRLKFQINLLKHPYICTLIWCNTIVSINISNEFVGVLQIDHARLYIRY